MLLKTLLLHNSQQKILHLVKLLHSRLTFIKGDQQIFSLLGRFNYAWDNQLIMTATFRRDGVSKFAQNNKYGFFPSLALAWQVDQSGLLDNTPLEELKIRMGWGQIGNHGIGSYGTFV